ncbi:MAG: DUF5723 family protein [Rikenellaceae bacterium]|jgi:hypothetical protein|nr:DUF5723 family protein [Rikenellaceae bacterium]
MKKIIISGMATLVCVMAVNAQEGGSSFYFDERYNFRSEFNPSFAPEQGYLALFPLGRTAFKVTSNIVPKTFIIPQDGHLVTLLDKSIPASYLNKVRDNNNVGDQVRLNLVSFGFYTGKSTFWDFSSQVKQRSWVTIPGDLIRMAKEGTGSSQRVMNLSSLNIGADLVIENSLGVSKDINEHLRVGLRGKYLAGLARADVRYNNFKATLGQDAWVVDADGVIRASTDLKYDLDSNGAIDWDSFDFGSFSKFKLTGNGFGVDLGATYKDFFVPRLTLALAVNDVGIMSWRQTLYAHAQGHADYHGFENVTGNVDDQYEQLVEDLEEMIRFRPDASAGGNKTQWLSANLRASAEYGIFRKDNRDLLSVGLSYMGYLNSPAAVNYHELMLAATYRPASWFSLSADVAKPFNYPFSCGLSMTFSGPVNFFVAAHVGSLEFAPRYYMPLNNLTTEFQFGLTFRIGKKRV